MVRHIGKKNLSIDYPNIPNIRSEKNYSRMVILIIKYYLWRNSLYCPKYRIKILYWFKGNIYTSTRKTKRKYARRELETFWGYPSTKKDVPHLGKKKKRNSIEIIKHVLKNLEIFLQEYKPYKSKIYKSYNIMHPQSFL